MALAPGPFRQLSSDVVNSDPGVYDFEDDAQDLSSKLLSIFDQMDDFLADLNVLASAPLDDLEDNTLDGIIAAIGVSDVMVSFPSIDTAINAYDVGDAQLTAAVSFAPAQAWVTPPSPFVPPDNAPPIVIPTVPIGAFDPGSYVSTSSQPNPAGPWVKLLNVTRVGQNSFTVGDQFEVLALGKPGQVLSVRATLNGKDLGQSDFGTLDSTGNFKLDGTMPPENAGAWIEQWYFDGNPIASFNFVVAPSGALL